MELYKVGQRVPEFIGHQEAPVFDLTDTGAVMIVFFNRPTVSEVAQFGSGKRFEIRFAEVKGVMMVAVKIGNLNWMDAPYSPHLSRNLPDLENVPEGSGVGLTLMLVDAATGEVKSLRLMGLSTRFTGNMFKLVKELKAASWDPGKYRMAINSIYASYSTERIAKLSTDYCKIG